MGTRMEGKVAIITGATLGLGKASALALAREGASVVICDRAAARRRTRRRFSRRQKDSAGRSPTSAAMS